MSWLQLTGLVLLIVGGILVAGFCMYDWVLFLLDLADRIGGRGR